MCPAVSPAVQTGLVQPERALPTAPPSPRPPPRRADYEVHTATHSMYNQPPHSSIASKSCQSRTKMVCACESGRRCPPTSRPGHAYLTQAHRRSVKDTPCREKGAPEDPRRTSTMLTPDGFPKPCDIASHSPPCHGRAGRSLIL